MTLDEFKQQLKPFRAVMGIDYGSRRIGVAVSDLMQTIATPYKIILCKNRQADLSALQEIIKQKEVGAIIYGLPLLMNGSEGETAAAVRQFADTVYAANGLPFAFWDERLSSAAVENFFIREADLSRGKRKKILDASAAAYILQGALDYLARK